MKENFHAYASTMKTVQEQSPQAELARRKKIRILLVDWDGGRKDPDKARYLRFLSDNGFRVDFRQTYRRFSERLEKVAYDLLLLEVEALPGTRDLQIFLEVEGGRSTGIRALREAQKTGITVPPVVILTKVHVTEEFHGDSLRSQFSGIEILYKPVGKKVLLEALHKAAGR